MPRLPSLLLALALVVVAHGARAGMFDNGAPFTGVTSLPLLLNASGTSGQYDGKISVSGGGSQAGHGLNNYTAAQHNFNTYDGTIQFSIGLQAGAAEYWQAQGGLTGKGANFYATNGTLSGNVDGNFVAQNSGNLWFGSGSGWGLEIADAAAAITNNLTVTGGTSTTDPALGSTSNIALSVPSGNKILFNVGGVVVGAFANSKSVGSTTNYPQFFASTGAVGYQCVNASASGAVNCLIQAQSTGNVTLANGAANLAVFANSDLNTIADQVVFKAASSAAPVRVTSNGGTSVAIGSTGLAANATAGFAMISLCNAAAGPTGTPALASGFAPICYNATTHTWNVYDSVSNGWYHLTLTAGAG